MTDDVKNLRWRARQREHYDGLRSTSNMANIFMMERWQDRWDDANSSAGKESARIMQMVKLDPENSKHVEAFEKHSVRRVVHGLWCNYERCTSLARSLDE